MVEVGDLIKIIRMNGEPQYTGKIGYVESIDDLGQILGSCGGCALIENIDIFEILSKNNENC